MSESYTQGDSLDKFRGDKPFRLSEVYIHLARYLPWQANLVAKYLSK